MDNYTFGKTPAALYLARVLTELDDKSLNKTIGRRITSTNNTVRDLLNAYDTQILSAKTLANCLRLLRLEIVNDSHTDHFIDCSIVDQLRRNVQIGIIKRGLRLSTISRKAERVMQSPDSRSCDREVVDVRGGGFEAHYKFKDSNSNKIYSAGVLFYADELSTPEVFITHYEQCDIDDITPELLMERSNRRCLRQNKPHMIEGGFVHPKG